MDIVSACPLTVGTLVWQPRPNAWVVTVVCKATYHLRPGECVLATEQAPVLETDAYWDDDINRGMRVPGDLVPVKPRADVLLVGSAFAPGGKPARSIVARLNVGGIDKSLEVTNDRVVSQGARIQEGGPFVRLPIVYERAAGGPGTWNPIGVRVDARDAYGRRTLPNIVVPGTNVTDMTTAVEPVGFGPIAANWPSRMEKLGADAARFMAEGYREKPLPEGIDRDYFNQAPRDQQIAELSDQERIVLENLHPEHARIVTRLPGVRPAVFLSKQRAGSLQRLGMRPDTLWIDTDRAMVHLVFRGQATIESRDEKMRIVVLLERSGQDVSIVEAERALSQHENEKASKDSKLKSVLVPVANPDDENMLVGTIMLHVSSGQTPQVAPLPFAGAPATATPRKDASSAQQPDGALPFQSTGSSYLPVALPPPTPIAKGSTIDLGSSPQPAPDLETLPPVRRPMESSAWPVVNAAAPAAPKPPAWVPPQTAAPSASTSRDTPESPWAAGNSVGSGPPPETIGMAAAAALAVSPAPAPAVAPIPAVRPIARVRADTRELLKLLWFDPESVPRIRRKKPFRDVLGELESKPLDPDLDDPALVQDPAAMEDRREIFEIMAHAPVAEAERIHDSFNEAIREDGKFVTPLLMLAGDLVFHFDELETLKATLTAVTPLVTPGDDVLKANIELARDFLKTPGLLSGPLVAEGLTSRLKDAFAQGKRMVPIGYLDQQTERALLENRSYQKRRVFGGPHLRALLHVSGSSQVVPTYLPADLAEDLPLYQRFRARVIVEVHPQEDQSETNAFALRVLAIARASALPKR